jgi:hypothetical protein
MDVQSFLDKCEERVGKLERAIEDKGSTPANIDTLNGGIVKVRTKVRTYAHRNRSQFTKPEYDFNRIVIAEHGEALLAQAIKKKVNRVLCAGWEFTGLNNDAVEYVKMRVRLMEHATETPWFQMMSYLFKDLFSQQNHMWVAVRSSKKVPGKPYKTNTGATRQPVAGYFPLPFETLKLKNKGNGELISVMQTFADGNTQEFPASNLVHFFANRRVGFTVGMPDVYPALEDISLLRHLEDMVQELIETNLFPIYHIKVGTESARPRTGPDGMNEVDIVKRKVEYMPPGAVYVSDYRQEVKSVNVSNQAVNMEAYLAYFKARVVAGMGMTAMDFGDGSGTTRSNASTMSKNMMLDIEAMALVAEQFINFYIIRPMLMEGEFSPIENTLDNVEIKFGVIDREEKRASENHITQMFQNNVITMEETRKKLGENPWTDESFNRSHQKMFSEPKIMVTNYSPEKPFDSILSELPVSNFSKKDVMPNAVSSETARINEPKSEKGEKSSQSRNEPSNQHGRRVTAKTTRDMLLDELAIRHEAEKLETWTELVDARVSLTGEDVSWCSVAETLLWRLENEH